MVQTGDFRFIRSLNAQVVLNLIRKNEVISSSELVHITGLRPSTIFNILKELSEKGLILNLGKGESTEKGGKKPFLWKLNSKAATVIGLDIELSSISAVLLDLEGNIINRKRVKFGFADTLDSLIDNIVEIVNILFSESEEEREKVIGMGIGLPAIVNSKSGKVIRSDIFPEYNVNLSQKLSEKLEFPIVIANNANAMAVGAKWLGAGKEFKDFIAVLVEFDKNVGGMGVGIIIDEMLYMGHSYCAGELNKPLPNLEQMLILIRNNLKESETLSEFDMNPDDLSVDDLINAVKKDNDKLAQVIFKDLGYNIGKIIASSIALLNPEALIIAGNISELDENIILPIKEVIERETLPFIHQNLEVRTSKYGADTVAIGAGALVLSDFFSMPLVNRSVINSEIKI